MRYVNEAGKLVLGAASALMLVFALLSDMQAISAQAEGCIGISGDECHAEVECSGWIWRVCKTEYYYYARCGIDFLCEVWV